MGFLRSSRFSRFFAPTWILFFGILISSEAHAPHPHFEEAIITYVAVTVPLWILFEVLHHVITKDYPPPLDGARRGE